MTPLETDSSEEVRMTNEFLAEPLDVVPRRRPAACGSEAVSNDVGHPVRLPIDTAEEGPVRRAEERSARRPANRTCGLLYPWGETKPPRDRSRRHRRVPESEG